MNLAVDIGNSRTKIGVFQGSSLLDRITWQSWDSEELLSFATNHNVRNIILCSVSRSVFREAEALREAGFYCIELNAQTPLPFKNSYRTPETLGKDRLAAVAGALQLHPGMHCLVVDAGTCVTFDILTSEGVYLGGNIAPGVRMRLDAMHQFTARLPKVEPGDPEDWIGDSTENALRNGAQTGVAMELEGYIERCKENFGPICVILTGGDVIFFAKNLKSKIFVNHDLVLIGLNKILNYNVERLE